MKLYYTPGACSLAPHIVLREAGYRFELEIVDLAAKRTAGGADYRGINPKGYVPALELDDGSVLTEVGAIIQYLAEQKPGLALVPKAGTMECYRELEWINFIGTEIHKNFSPLWNPKMSDEARQSQIRLLGRRLEYLAAQLKDRQFVMGASFTAADAYLYAVLNWAGMLKVDLTPWPVLQTYIARISARPAVVEALKAEGQPT